ncbi:MAG: enoyl-CoA hydratase/isomerase family protein [Phycisphaeraceae bacterium]|nr:MAG: enoyl-CoA hydratase/isomerase family protein [Phycisphaeraceae bacterium]
MSQDPTHAPTEPFPILRDDATGVLTIRLDQPGKPVVVLDHPLIQRLDATLDHLPRDAAGLILASASPRVFIAGADLRSIHDWPDDQLHRYLRFGSRVFARLASTPFPTVAALNGAALGGGLEIALHCDGLVAAPSASGKPYPVGLPEASLSICPGWGGTNLLPARLDPALAIARTASGTPFTSDEAKDLGLFDAFAPSPDTLIDTATRWLLDQRGTPLTRDGAPRRWIGRPATAARVLAALDQTRASLPNTDVARAVARAVDAGLTRGWDDALGVERDELVRLRHTPAGKAAIEAFFARK